MRGFLLGVLLTTAALRSDSAIQSNPIPPPPPPVIYGWIDSPSWYMPQEYGPNFTVIGWTFDCRSGQQPPFVAVLDHDMQIEGTGQTPVKWITQYTVTRAISRHDVQGMYAPYCPGMSDAVGYQVTINEPLGRGLHFLSVFWTTGDGKAQSVGIPVQVP